jgi:hypothetical protein
MPTLLPNGDLRLSDGRTAPSYLNLVSEAKRRGMTPSDLSDACLAPHAYGKQAFESAKTNPRDHCPWTQMVDMYTTWARTAETRLCKSCSKPTDRPRYCSPECKRREKYRRRSFRDTQARRSPGSKPLSTPPPGEAGPSARGGV